MRNKVAKEYRRLARILCDPNLGPTLETKTSGAKVYPEGSYREVYQYFKRSTVTPVNNL
jgi:hypothetical protein